MRTRKAADGIEVSIEVAKARQTIIVHVAIWQQRHSRVTPIKLGGDVRPVV